MPNLGTGGSDPFLNPTDQFVFLAFHVSQIIVGQLTIRLLELPLNDIPISF